MYALEKLFDELIALFQTVGISVSDNQFVQPPDASMGDISFACFDIARERKQSPQDVARECSVQMNAFIEKSLLIAKVEGVGPYINITVNTAAVAGMTLENIATQNSRYGFSVKENKVIQFEYSQPNTHKAFHIGHVRNAVLGFSLAKLLEAVGNEVHSVTYVNDVGSHVAKCLWALSKMDTAEIPEHERGRFLGNVYARASELLEKNPDDKKEVQLLLQKLEQGDSDAMALWKETRQWSLDGFDAIYKEMNIVFEQSYSESDVKDLGHKAVDRLLAQGIAKESEGVIIMDFRDENLDVLVIRKSDGTGLYATSDLGLAQVKARETWDESIVLTDMRQELYFKQMFATLRLLGIDKNFKHYGYELVRLTSGSMSSRKGAIILYEDFRDEMIVAAKRETSARHVDWNAEKINEVARALAMASIKFSMLKVKPEQIITFDMHEALSFTGFSAPYILYTFARIASILEKCETETPSDYGFEHPSEKKLLMMLAWYPRVVEQAAREMDPSRVCKFLHDLAREFGVFYEQCSIVHATENVASARVRLARAVAQVIENGMAIVGIKPMREM